MNDSVPLRGQFINMGYRRSSGEWSRFCSRYFYEDCAQAGFHIFGKREYYSNIKGEHSYFTVRVSDEPIRSHVDLIDILVSFDAETVFVHASEVKEGGGYNL